MRAVTLGVHHIAVNAHDVAGTARLYAEGLGFTDVAEVDGVRWMAAPNLFVAIHPAARAPGRAERSRRVCDPGITHFCVQSGDGTGTWDRLDAAGLAFNAAPVALGTGATYAYGRDPECNVIEAEGVGDAPADAPPWIAHVALATADLDRLADFYAALIGRAPHREGTFANALFEDITGLKDVRVSAKWLMADNLTVELWRYHNPPTLIASPPEDGAPGYRHIGFVAEDAAREAARIARAGIAIDEGEGRFAGRDPDGNRFVMMQAPQPGDALDLASLTAPHVVADRSRAQPST